MRPAAPILLTVLAAAPFASAQTQAPPSPAAAVTRLFSGPVQPAWLAPSFLAALPAEALQAALTGLTGQVGAFVRTEARGELLVAVFERGELNVLAALDEQGRFTDLRFTPLPLTAAEGPGSPREVLSRIFSGPFDASLFAPSFLAAVPEAQLRALLADVTAQFGALKDVQIGAQIAGLIFERGQLNVTQFSLDNQGRVTGLLLTPPPPVFTSLDEARAAFAALPGQVSLLVQEVGATAPAVALNVTRPLAVGSTFKLAILAELQSQVNAGQKQWTDEVTLTDADRSLPSGTLQDAPTGSRYTLRDLAARMIAQSDNTATDLLLGVVGRAGVEARFGQRPFPSTREAFALKNPGNAALLAEYRAAVLNVPARRAVLDRARMAPLPAATDFAGGPLARDVEWFATPATLCRLMAGVAALKETQLNPGVADPARFRSVSYKGGSEPGVLNLTTQITTLTGRTYCVSATWNAPGPLQEDAFVGLYGATLDLLR
ncbi:serine hydrolase [Deinococcus soli (ex Cha et al. 2016)]|uniref:Beta-lactamase class A n=2 Tax=Deinococcus soli (ex Cha et al. 2016) TaxID=1309411 RepID=A0ACC6KNM1_9DEIO|nr:serine hydrolase [Deinococcus soli (ex Cha et al. 2016)]MDR6220916.1 beta-lactamase class A [Deinococcus soli (ex Cha et al. 2016)]MDR6330900.1 beta-lactamase class A [Deinococcus soli (ex Cha et al. 2016)]MDR6754086.1 beta-lactamase class A [Deinococcus soli (ex Cha et al. 2016)]